jgi:predicted MFS family arabinose efflux permease
MSGSLSAASPRALLSRRGAFAAAAYAFAITMLGTTLPTPLYAIYRQRFGFSELMVTVVFATYAVGVIAALVLVGQLSDRIGRRRVLLPGLALSALSAVAFLLAHGVGIMLVGRLLSGLSAGIFTGTATATLVDLAPPEARGRATLVATLANMLGLGCGPLLAGLLAQFVGAPLRLPFWVDLALLAAAAVLVWAMPEPVAVSGPVRLRPQRLHVPPQVRAVFVPAALAAFAGFSVLGLFTSVAPGFLSQILGFPSHATAGMVVFGVFAASGVGQLGLERIRSAVALPAGCAALIAGMGLVALGLALPSLALLLAGGLVAGLGQGLSFRAGLTVLNERAPADRRAAVASSFFVIAYVAISVPVVGVGVVTQLAGLRTAGLVFAAVVAALALAVLAILTRQAGRRDEGRAPAT